MAKSNLAKNLIDWNFCPSKLTQLPIDPILENYRRTVRNCIFSHVTPTPLKNPKLVAYSNEALENILDMDVDITKTDEFVDFVAGNKVLDGSAPLAHRYGGFQFGNFAMQLGDGRAILLGEYINRKGERWELNIKGAGRTPYSRDGDGRAVLRSSIREFLCSEAMHYLGIPTSRAAIIIVSEDEVLRDVLYNGNSKMEKTSVVLRLAPSWFRFGSFEILNYFKETDLLRDLLDFILKEHFPDIPVDSENKVVEFIKRIITSTMDLVILWNSYGFNHGILNTDNMSILGITIDYGPFGFLGAFDPDYVSSATDHTKFYRFGRQAHRVLANLFRFQMALKSLMDDDQIEEIQKFMEAETENYLSKYYAIYSKKLGLNDSVNNLVDLFLEILYNTQCDYTMAFRQLGENNLSDIEDPDSNIWALFKISKHESYLMFLEQYKEVLLKQDISEENRMAKMVKTNPRYILRNWMAEEVIKKAEEDDFTGVHSLLEVLKRPYTKQTIAEELGYASPKPSWADSIVLSCSS